MPLDIVFDQDRGGFLFSSQSKSQLPVPVAFTKDLDGCGEPTHIQTRVGAALSARVRCQSPRPILLVNMSTLTSIAPVGTVDPLPRGVPLTATDDQIVAFLLGSIYAAAIDLDGTVRAAVPGRTLTVAQRTLNRRGTSYVFDGLKDGLERIEVGVPQVYGQYDNCNKLLGVKGQISYSYTAYDLETCRPQLAHQISLGIMIDRIAVPAGEYGGLFPDVASGLEAITQTGILAQNAAIDAGEKTLDDDALQDAIETVFVRTVPQQITVPYTVVDTLAPGTTPGQAPTP